MSAKKEPKLNYHAVFDEIVEYFKAKHDIPIKESLIAEYASQFLVKSQSVSEYSGLVIAGYGEKEIFPHLEEYCFDTVVNNKPRKAIERTEAISYQKEAEICAFAQKEMVQTMLEGVNPEYNRVFLRESLAMWPALLDEVLKGTENKQQLMDDARKPFIEAFKVFLRKMELTRERLHKQPILDAVAMMPIGELAAVAETLVNMTQIKHRLTLDTETVGGPIDVAVISKGDGFVWINRKHYFNQELNPHFATRYFCDKM